jgi:hypothetical protein
MRLLPQSFDMFDYLSNYGLQGVTKAVFILDGTPEKSLLQSRKTMAI